MNIFNKLIEEKKQKKESEVKEENNTVLESFEDSSSEEDELFQEAVFIDTLRYNKTLNKLVNLPFKTNKIGRGCLALLYTHNINESLELMNNKGGNCFTRNKYHYYFYNLFYQGRLYNRKFRFRDTHERLDLYSKVKSETDGIIGRLKLINTEHDNKNMFYDLYRYLNIFTSICGKLSPVRYIVQYWNYMNKILNIEIPGYTTKFILVNLQHYKLTKKIRDNLENPLFLIYFTLYKNPDLLKNVDIEFYFFSKNKVLKINPSTLVTDDIQLIRTEMKRIMSNVVSEEIVDVATSEEEIAKEDIVETATSNITQKIIKDDNKVIESDEDLKALKKLSNVEKEIKKKVEQKVQTAGDIVPIVKISPVKKQSEEPVRIQNSPDDSVKKKYVQAMLKRTSAVEKIKNDEIEKEQTDEITKIVEKNVKKEINEDREMIQKIYYSNQKKTQKSQSTASTERDRLLREEQRKIKVGNMTLEELGKVKTEDIPIEVKDVSKALRTTNEHVKQVRYTNFEKDYNKHLMKKDITDAILSLNDKSIPMFVRDIKVEDTSDELNYKETYTVLLEDSNRKRHTVKVDIPKFLDDKFLYIGGNKKVIKHQSFLLPVVKIAPDTVQIVTNYSKLTITRNGNKSISYVEKLKKLITTDSNVAKYFVNNSVYANNIKFITTLEYDDLSKYYSHFKCGKTFLMFDQAEVYEYMNKNNIPKKNNKIYIGKRDGEDCYIDINTQEDEKKNSIVEIIFKALPGKYQDEYLTTKAPKRLVYTSINIMSQNISVAMLLGLWEGITSLFEKLKLNYRLADNTRSLDLSVDEEFLKFKDTILIYKQDVPTALIMNGFRLFDTTRFNFADFDEKDPYIEYIKRMYGKAMIENALMNFYEFFMDPITKEVCDSLDIPTDICGIIIYGVHLLADKQYENVLNQNLSRIRTNEIVPGILYDKLAKGYVNYRNSNGKKKYSIQQDSVIKEILAQKTTEDYSVLNPSLEMTKLHEVSTKGFRGINLDEYYTMARRGYDNSMVGVVAPVTSPDGQCGVTRQLVTEPAVTNLRGVCEDHFNSNTLDKLNDVNLFSPEELILPLAVTIDDPNRLG